MKERQRQIQKKLEKTDRAGKRDRKRERESKGAWEMCVLMAKVSSHAV